MSGNSAVVSVPFRQQSGEPEPRQTASQRLKEIKASLQRQLRRRPSEREKEARDDLAWLKLRYEIALRDPSTSASDIRSLSTAMKRQREYFDRVCGMPASERGTPTLGQLLKGKAHDHD